MAAAPRAPSGARRVLGAVRLVGHRLRPAEEEAGGPRIADRPAAGFIVQFEQRAALAARDARVGPNGLDIGLGIDDPGRQRSFPEPPGGALCVYGRIGGTGVGCVASAGCAAVGRLVGDAEAMNLPPDGVVGDAMAPFPGDLPPPPALRHTSPPNTRSPHTPPCPPSQPPPPRP